jgi:hypothetical protein
MGVGVTEPCLARCMPPAPLGCAAVELSAVVSPASARIVATWQVSWLTHRRKLACEHTCRQAGSTGSGEGARATSCPNITPSLLSYAADKVLSIRCMRVAAPVHTASSHTRVCRALGQVSTASTVLGAGEPSCSETTGLKHAVPRGNRGVGHIRAAAT